jgi:hypothetical protein
MTKTNYVIVIGFDPSNNYLENQLLVGWDNKSDYYTEVEGSDILTPTGRLKKTNGVGCIKVDRWIGCYVDSDLKWITEFCKSSGYNNCIVCRLEKNIDNEIIVVPENF